MDHIQPLLDSNLLENKRLYQIISFLGNGKLKDGDDTFRAFLRNVSNDILVKYADECTDKGFNDSGFALQDIVNEIGSRLGFNVTHGLYRGNKTDIGFDGVWRQDNEWSLVIEVKTTDAYRISLDAIGKYRRKLIDSQKITESLSSILIIVGREDTGEIEAQIRGSKHAWDIRIISISSLIRLLRIKESLSDESTAQKISIALRPYEFTRVDKLIELLFLAIKDVEVEEKANDLIEYGSPATEKTESEPTERAAPASFHQPALEKIKAKLSVGLIKQSRSTYSSNDGTTGIVVSISKQHPPFNNQFDARYWFAFHPHQEAFLDKFQNGYACYGCGDEQTIFAIPLTFIRPKLNDMWKTKNGEKDYKHIVIYRREGKYFLRTNINDQEHYDDLESFKL